MDSEGSGHFVIEESLGYLVNYAARGLGRELSRRLASSGVGLGQWSVLMFLWAGDGQSQRELSRRVAIEDATMVRTLDRMERDDLVRRERDSRDRRRIRVFLTEKGWNLREELVPQAIEANRLTTQDLSEVERGQLLDLLGRVIGTMEARAGEREEERNG